jgi:hypothetical protein
MQPTIVARVNRGPFEDHADRLDLRALLSERSELADPLHHPSAWPAAGTNVPAEPPRAL